MKLLRILHEEKQAPLSKERTIKFQDMVFIFVDDELSVREEVKHILNTEWRSYFRFKKVLEDPAGIYPIIEKYKPENCIVVCDLNLGDENRGDDILLDLREQHGEGIVLMLYTAYLLPSLLNDIITSDIIYDYSKNIRLALLRLEDKLTNIGNQDSLSLDYGQHMRINIEDQFSEPTSDLDKTRDSQSIPISHENRSDAEIAIDRELAEAYRKIARVYLNAMLRNTDEGSDFQMIGGDGNLMKLEEIKEHFINVTPFAREYIQDWMEVMLGGRKR